jgi:ATP-binding cassette, subfamily B, bacterial CvaB/MchF/RaxB
MHSSYSAAPETAPEDALNAATARLRFGFRRRTPLYLQAERAECGLACLCMIAGFYGSSIELPELRRLHPVSQKGLSAVDIIDTGAELGLACRPLKLELDELGSLSLPAILHWDMKHFVVLTEKRGSKYIVHDPGQGELLLSVDAIGESFTGVAIEAFPTPDFKRDSSHQRPTASSLLEGIGGIRSTLWFLLSLGLVLELLGLLGPLANQFVIDQAIVSLDLDLVIALALGMSLLLMGQVLLVAYRSWVVTYLGTKISLHVTTRVFKHLLSLRLDYFQKRQVGDIVTRFDSVTFIQRVLTTGMVEAALDGVLVIGTLAMMMVYSRLFASLSLVACVGYGAIRYVLFKSLYRFSDVQLAAASKRQSAFLESVRAIQSIKLARRQHERLSQWLNASVDEQNASAHLSRYTIVFKASNSLLFGLDGILFLALAATAIMSGQFSVGMLFSLTAYKAQFSTRVASLIDKAFEFRLLAVHVRRVAEIVGTPAEPGAATMPLPNDLAPFIEVKNVSYRHSAREPFIFRNLNLTVAAGESVSIIGPSGCGKSTLIRLIIGADQPVEGEILIGGVPLCHLRDRIIGGYMTVVMQGDQLLSGSVLENISFFDRMPDFQQVVASAKLAGIHDEILSMPMGYQTLLGDMGSVLSGGEKQRLLLARALYPRPKILILDEATANVDIFREREINASLATLGITKIVIAHRRETCLATDRQVRFGELLVDGRPVLLAESRPSSAA